MTTIEVQGLTKRFGRVVAVRELSFSVPAGTITGFLGPNGAGKTTTLRSLLGLVYPDGGSATIEGRRYVEIENPARSVGAVLEAASFHKGRSGRNHLRWIAAAGGIPYSRVEEVLALVELTDSAKRRVGGYSLGMRQRLALAAALLGDPRVLILDEPANGLDPQGIRWLRDFLQELRREGRTILVSSHVLSEIAQTVDNVVIIHRGRFVTQGSVEEISGRAAGGVRVRSPERDRLRELLASAGQTATPFDEDGLAVADTTPARVGEVAASSGVVLHELVAEAGTLEEAFLELTRAEEQEPAA
jgi:ABC-2 type transport system ATP-binding protein